MPVAAACESIVIFCLMQAVEHEGNANVAWSLVRSWHQTIQDAHDTKTVGSFYNRALAVCQQASNPDLVAEVMRTMQQNGIAVQSATLSEA